MSNIHAFIPIMRKKKQDSIVLSREQLYKEIWSVPISQLAKQYNISDTGLAKICKRMKVPRPPRGYWAKRDNGHPTRKKALKPLDGNGIGKITIDKTTVDVEALLINHRSVKSQRHIERKKINRLNTELQNWEMSNRIRAYISDMRSTGDKKTDGVEFLAWADSYANHLDPAVDFRIAVLDEA